jgi:Domain of unknown function (DUF1707)
METGPGGRDAAAGRLRASDADRERVVALLQVAFAEGLLTRDEFGERIGDALTARTYADLAALTAGIPAEVASAPRAAPARGRRPLGRRTVTGGWTLVTLAAMVTDAALTGNGTGPTAGLFSLLFTVAFVVAFVSWLYAVAVHRGDAAAGQPPAGQPPAGQPPAGPAPGGRGEAAASAGQPPPDDQAEHGPAQATRGRPARRVPPRPQPGWRVGLAIY